jgi:hypothetical protein
MKTIDMIRWSLQLTDGATAKLVEDMRGTPMTRATANGNHPIWLLGHLAFIEGGLVRIASGDANPLQHWAPLFAPGTQPKDDPSAYPSFDEIFKKFRDLRAANLKRLDEIGDAGLDAPPKWTPGGLEGVMPTLGHAFLIVALHQMHHHGQIADARRSAGRKPVLGEPVFA